MKFFNKNEVREFAKLVIISLLIIVPIRLYIAQPFIVRGASMDPTFGNGDYLVIDEVSYNFNDPTRGEVVVFRYPHDPAKFFIKRIIGLPGETIKIQNGRVSVFNNGHPEGFLLDENYVQGATSQNMSVTLGEEEYFVMGDNRPHSSDSRYWGALSGDLITGRAWLRLWPPGQAELWPGF